MKYVFYKEGYDFVASNENDHDAIHIRNVSKLKTIRNLVNWLVSDVGFKYQTRWLDVDYEISPNFGGYGYSIKDDKGNKIGKVKSGSFGSVRILETRQGQEILLEERSPSEYALKVNSTEIGAIKTNSIINRFPIEVDLYLDEQPATHLLALFAVLKCV
ncbi:Uncharacterised protein [BD1-7 clade bacterium]|uniref:Uncharacterized protein n=1 Tax=BD1-7 clade bacterium TaxID=2029982 RepID=A0A5S9PZX8_9GAMM|nr:Uncharacterised protein [BD1-7 clade bacterium]